jgi:Fic family protein
MKTTRKTIPDVQSRFVTSTVTGEKVRAFVPAPLPPAFNLESLQPILEQANQAIGRLDGTASSLPDLRLFLYSYVRKEAVLSSQIEGTQSSLSDLLLFENAETPGAPLDDVQEVSNYVAALNHGLSRLRGNFPLSLRLIREIHDVLLSKGRGSHAHPGEFRTSQNWIGGTRPGNAAYVPPPPEYVLPCMSQLEKFLHDDQTALPLLIRAGLAHAQFESIHPFLDGNGRIGRLLITFMLCAEGILREPVLYLSLFFKQHRRLYYDRLTATRYSGDWTGWLDFFLQAVRDTANQAADTAGKIDALFRKDREKIDSFGRGTASTLLVYRYAQTHVLFSIRKAAQDTKLPFPTTSAAVARMTEAGILHQAGGNRRNRIFVYQRYLDLLNQEF